MAEWYNLTAEETFSKLGSGPKGLSSTEARKRLERYGPNELMETRRISPLKIFLTQFLDLMVIILLIAAFISAAIGFYQNTVEELYDAIVIMFIVVFNAIFGFVQEYRAEKAIEALKAMAAPRATVVRDGEPTQIPSREIVPGDVVLLSAGVKVPADCRLIEVASLRVNEASLTGESVPISKDTEPLSGDVYLGDRSNMVFMGCTVEAGRGSALVVETGMNTELGKIAGMVQAEEPEQTPLQRKLDTMGKQIGVGIIGACVVIFIVGYLQTEGLIVEMFLTAVSLAVAAIPEGLPAVVTISLALGLQRMARRNALIRRLPAVETLGGATVICSDKTGTLTKGEMNIREIFVGGVEYRVEGEGFEPEGRFLRDGEQINPQRDPDLTLLLRAGLLCNDASLVEKEDGWTIRGDTTEGTLIVAAARAGYSKERLEKVQPRVGEIPFSSERKRMTTIHQAAATYGYMKGAPEIVLELCDSFQQHGKARPLGEAGKMAILERSRDMASRALRVLGLAYRELPLDWKELSEEELESGYTFLGLVGMIDAPRSDAIEAIEECKRAGIKVIMITGDHKLTATAIAREMGILAEGDIVLTGSKLEKMSEEDLEKVVERVSVYARVSPQHKVKIVDALKRKGHIVAMTGDGVNDAPALKRADIGVAMGITGTDVAKESSEMVLTDDNFASIVHAVEEGRGIYDNIRKFVAYLLSANAGEVLLMFIATMIFIDPRFLPFLAPIQLLWINLVTDGFPALALGVDPIPEDIMERPPLRPDENPISREMMYMIIGVGIIILVGTLGLFSYEIGLDGDVDRARTVAFSTIVMFEMYFVFSVRSPRQPIYKGGLFSNKMLWVAVFLSILLQLSVVYLPFLQPIFKTVPLGWMEWVRILLVSSTVLLVMEMWKTGRLVLLERRRAGKKLRQER